MVPNVRYRRDIGDGLVNGDLDTVERLALLDAPVDRAGFRDSRRGGA
jgi:hypothetical protein